MKPLAETNTDMQPGGVVTRRNEKLFLLPRMDTDERGWGKCEDERIGFAVICPDAILLSAFDPCESVSIRGKNLLSRNHNPEVVLPKECSLGFPGPALQQSAEFVSAISR
jgi:hypothetical protein